MSLEKQIQEYLENSNNLRSIFNELDRIPPGQFARYEITGFDEDSTYFAIGIEMDGSKYRVMSLTELKERQEKQKVDYGDNEFFMPSFEYRERI